MLKNMGIRNKLLFSYSIIFTLSLSLGSAFIYYFVKQTITVNIESELTNTTTTLLNMVRTAADVSIKNHLRAVAEKNLEIVAAFYRQYQSGRRSENEAKELASAILLSQTIGQSGYIYCIDSSGKVVVHPQTALLGTNVLHYQFIQDQIALKKGYIAYDWKNPGEAQKRPKALYMAYFAPWDWIISVSSYRKEFRHLVNVDDFRESILSLKFGDTGYSYVVDSTGRAIVHAKIQGLNILQNDDIPHQFLQDMLQRKSGKLIYSWKNPEEPRARKKLVIFNHIPEFDWIVASSSYLEEFYRPLTTIRNLVIATVAVTLFLVLPITFEISSSITKPLGRLMQYFDRVKTNDFSYRMEIRSHNEIGQLASHFNHFMQQLESYSADLQKEIAGRQRVEDALRESETRYRSVMAAAPDPIVLYDMQGKVTYLNPAFTRIFGWLPHECMGRTMDHFVPEENWAETRMMIRKVLSGESLSDIETRRYNKKCDLIWVRISGATFRDRRDRLAGSVIILRDITKSKHLEQQLMLAGDRERQRIGQDLHDDLCPHLIGIQGLCTALSQDLLEKETGKPPLLDTIIQYIDDAIQKARDLARGLCPVHLVAHGLETALEEITAKTQAATGIVCSFVSRHPVVLSNNTVATHLFYIALEAVTNAVKHAAPKHIEISLQLENGTIHMAISDDGAGISEDGNPTGMGLQIMQQRAKMIGAAVAVATGPETGTTIHVRIEKTLATGKTLADSPTEPA